MEDEGRRRRGRGAALIALLVVAALVVIAAVVALAILRDGDDEAAPTRAEAELTTVDDLRALAEAQDGPVFWAGPQPGMQYELTQTTDGRIYIRYLPADVEVGDPRGIFLTVGTYPAADGFAVTQRLGEADGAVVEQLEGGGVAVYNEETPTSVYLAFPGINRQIEVFHPDPEEARRLAYTGAIMPILVEEATPEQTGQPVGVTEDELRQIAAERELPIYWLGPRDGVTYELTRLPNGQVYVRYLPEGVEVGDRTPEYETVGTYPAENGVAAIEEAARNHGAETFEPPGGGLAYFAEGTPTNVHFAPPGASYQVEVFHPQAGSAEELVRGGEAVPIQ